MQGACIDLSQHALPLLYTTANNGQWVVYCFRCLWLLLWFMFSMEAVLYSGLILWTKKCSSTFPSRYIQISQLNGLLCKVACTEEYQMYISIVNISLHHCWLNASYIRGYDCPIYRVKIFGLGQSPFIGDLFSRVCELESNHWMVVNVSYCKLVLMFEVSK